MANNVPSVAAEAVLVQSKELPVEPVEVKGYDFNEGINYHKLLQSFRTSGFQATNFGMAVEEINKMVTCIDDCLKANSFNHFYNLKSAYQSYC